MTQLIHVCKYCGSPRVFADAYVALNTDEVRTYDYTHCDDCGDKCHTTTVEVGEDFVIETDTFDLSKD